MARGRLVVKHDVLVKGLAGCFEEHHAFMIGVLLDTIDHLTGQIEAFTERIDQLLASTAG